MTVAINAQNAGLFSDAAYKAKGSGAPLGWTEDESLFGQSGDNQFRVFVNDDTHQVVFAFKGTNTFSQFLSDLGNAGATQYQELHNLADASLTTAETVKYVGYQILTDGHSLGGGMAQSFALENELNGFGQNSLPIASDTITTYFGLRDGGVNGALASYYLDNHSFIETNVAGDPATLWYSTLGHGLYLDSNPTTLPSVYAIGEFTGLLLGGVTGGVSTAAAMGMTFTAHQIGTFNSLATNYVVGSDGHLVVGSSAQQQDASGVTGTFNQLQDVVTNDDGSLTITEQDGTQWNVQESSASTNEVGLTLSQVGEGSGTFTVTQTGTNSSSGSWTGDDGSSGSYIYNEDESYSISTDDGQGDTETDNYDADGNAVSSDWQHADGSYGNWIDNPDGSSHNEEHFADGSWTSSDTNSNGSANTYTNDGHGDSRTNSYDVAGDLVSDSWANADGSYGSDTYALNGNSHSESHGADGSWFITDRNADGGSSDTWQDADGSYGSDTHSADGAFHTESHYANGGWETHDRQPDGSFTGSWAGLAEIKATSSSGEESYDASSGERTLHEQWLDGRYLNSVTESDGSYGKSWSNADGSTGDESLAVSTGEYALDHTYADGSDDSLVRHGDGSSHAESHDVDGSWSITDTGADGSYSNSWEDADGSYGSGAFNGDGSGSSITHYADDSYSTYEKLAYGYEETDNYDADGTLVSDSWQNTAESYGSDTFYPDGSSHSEKHELGYSIEGQWGWNWTVEDKVTEPDGSYTDRWISNDSYGDDSYDAADGQSTSNLWGGDGGYGIGVTQDDGSLYSEGEGLYGVRDSYLETQNIDADGSYADQRDWFSGLQLYITTASVQSNEVMWGDGRYDVSYLNNSNGAAYRDFGEGGGSIWSVTGTDGSVQTVSKSDGSSFSDLFSEGFSDALTGEAIGFGLTAGGTYNASQTSADGTQMIASTSAGNSRAIWLQTPDGESIALWNNTYVDGGPSGYAQSRADGTHHQVTRQPDGSWLFDELYTTPDGTSVSDEISSDGARTLSIRNADGISVSASGDVPHYGYPLLELGTGESGGYAPRSYGLFENSPDSITAHADDSVSVSSRPNGNGDPVPYALGWTASDGGGANESVGTDGAGHSEIYGADGSSYIADWELNGNFLAHWSSSDGSSGDESYDSLSGQGQSDYHYADGSYGTTIANGDGSVFADYHNSDGSYGDSTAALDGTFHVERHNADGSWLVSDTSADGSYAFSEGGSNVQAEEGSYDASTGEYHDTYRYADGTYGGVDKNADGSIHAEIHYADGSYGLVDGSADGDSHSEFYSASDSLELINDTETNADGGYTIYAEGINDWTLTQTYDVTGKLLTDDWTHPDGSHGSDTYNPDNSIASSEWTSYYADGSYNTYTKESDGNAELDHYDADGTNTGDNWWSADGTYGSDSFNSDDSSYQITHNDDGTWETIVVKVDGTRIDTLYDADGTSHVVGSGQNYGFTPGEGVVHLADTVNPGAGIDTLTFGSGVAADSLTLGLGSLLIRDGISGDEIHLDNFDPQNALGPHDFGTFHFSDGTTLTYEQLVAKGFDIYGTSGDETLTGTNLDNRIHAGTGNDVLIATGAHDILYGGVGNDTLIGGAGVDQLIGGSGDDTFIAGAGGNTLVGGSGQNTFVFNLGDGQATVIDSANAQSAQGGHDVVRFGTGITSTDINFVQRGSDVVIDYGSGSDSILVEDFDLGGVSGPAPISHYEFADGSTLAYQNNGQGDYGFAAFDSQGNPASTLTRTVNADGSSVTSTYTASSGVYGTDYVNADGSYTDYLTTYDGGGGYQQSWTASNATSGENDKLDDGSTLTRTVNADGSSVTSTYTASSGVYGTDYVNADGSYTDYLTTYDGGGGYQQSWTASNATSGENDKADDGSTLTRTVNADGSSVTSTYTASSGVYGTDYVNADGSYTDYLTTYDGGGGYQQSWTASNGTSGENDKLDDGSTLTRTVNADGSSVTSTYTANTGVYGTDYVNADGSFTDYSTTYDAGGGYQQSWTASNGTSGENDKLDDGSTLTRTVNADGSSVTSTYTANTGVYGTDYVNADGSFTDYSTTYDAGGGYLQSWTASNGNSGENDKADDGSTLTRTVNADGSSVTSTYTAGTGVYGTDYVNADGSYTDYGTTYDGSGGYQQSWAKSDGSAGSIAVDATGSIAGDSWLTSGGLQGVDAGGNHLLLGTAWADALGGGTGAELLIGGAGDDALATGAGTNFIAFNLGDGQDTVLANSGGDNVVSLGGNFAYSDLALQKAGNNLVLDVGSSDSLTFKDWYASPGNQNIVNLQVIAAAMSDYAPGSADVLRNARVETFDFQQMVGEFDQSQAVNSSSNPWSVTSALLDAHLAGSDSAALGGDLTYEYGTQGNLTGFGVAAAETTLSNAQFGSAPQPLSPVGTVDTGAVRLS